MQIGNAQVLAHCAHSRHVQLACAIVGINKHRIAVLRVYADILQLIRLACEAQVCACLEGSVFGNKAAFRLAEAAACRKLRSRSVQRAAALAEITPCHNVQIISVDSAAAHAVITACINNRHSCVNSATIDCYIISCTERQLLAVHCAASHTHIVSSDRTDTAAGINHAVSNVQRLRSCYRRRLNFAAVKREACSVCSNACCAQRAIIHSHILRCLELCVLRRQLTTIYADILRRRTELAIRSYSAAAEAYIILLCCQRDILCTHHRAISYVDICFFVINSDIAFGLQILIDLNDIRRALLQIGNAQVLAHCAHSRHVQLACAIVGINKHRIAVLRVYADILQLVRLACKAQVCACLGDSVFGNKAACRLPEAAACRELRSRSVQHTAALSEITLCHNVQLVSVDNAAAHPVITARINNRRSCVQRTSSLHHILLCAKLCVLRRQLTIIHADTLRRRTELAIRTYSAAVKAYIILLRRQCDVLRTHHCAISYVDICFFVINSDIAFGLQILVDLNNIRRALLQIGNAQILAHCTHSRYVQLACAIVRTNKRRITILRVDADILQLIRLACKAQVCACLEGSVFSNKAACRLAEAAACRKLRSCSVQRTAALSEITFCCNLQLNSIDSATALAKITPCCNIQLFSVDNAAAHAVITACINNRRSCVNSSASLHHILLCAKLCVLRHQLTIIYADTFRRRTELAIRTYSAAVKAYIILLRRQRDVFCTHHRAISYVDICFFVSNSDIAFGLQIFIDLNDIRRALLQIGNAQILAHCAHSRHVQFACAIVSINKRRIAVLRIYADILQLVRLACEVQVCACLEGSVFSDKTACRLA